MKLAMVTPRYGAQVIGGAETAARMLAERLARRPGWEVEVLTSCALDHLTWENIEDEGTSSLNGVSIRRFATSNPRVLEYFELDGRIRVAPAAASLATSRRWVALNGPMCPGLVDAVAETDADVVAFYPYLFATTVDGLTVCPVPTVLHPAAHDEPALYLRAFRQSFAGTDGLVYHTRAERRLVEGVFPVGAQPQIVLGLGVDEPTSPRREGAEVLGLAGRPYLCYLGRVDEHKGCGMLAEFFARYKERRPSDLALALVGPLSGPPPDHPDIVATGTVAEPDKWDVLRGAAAMVSPSAYESFSLVVLEAWTVGVPVVVNGTCAATMEHCRRSGGGLWFDTYASFEVVVDRLVSDGSLARTLAEAGARYTDTYYRWPALIDRYAGFIEQVASRGPKTRLRAPRLTSIEGGTAYAREQ